MAKELSRAIFQRRVRRRDGRAIFSSGFTAANGLPFLPGSFPASPMKRRKLLTHVLFQSIILPAGDCTSTAAAPSLRGFSKTPDTPWRSKNMRYIGNKTKLLGFIDRVMDELDIRSGVFCDLFAGTASVSRHMKERGFRIISADLMRYSYVLQRAYVVVDDYPQFVGLSREVGIIPSSRGDARKKALQKTVQFLNNLKDGQGGFIYRSYCPGGSGGRRLYFTDDNGRRIDVIRERLARWQSEGRLTADEYYLLLAALIEAADAVANISGVYCAFLKDLHPNARHRLKLKPPKVITGGSGEHWALLGDANELIERIRCDILYLDPPYNVRQYACNYHLLETIAEGWSQEEPHIYGKTGMRPYQHQRSRYCCRRKGEKALTDLVEKARERSGCTHLLMSYNDEGVVPRTSIEKILRESGLSASYRTFRRKYRRFRSDSDGPNRRYRRSDRVTEWIHYIRFR
jgi:adenine-specific DNA-methyltransferase